MLLFILSALLALGAAEKNFTVTAEIELEVEVKNYNGNGDDINGVVTVGIFGDSVPVAALNFKTLCSGFKRPQLGKVSYKNTYCHRIVKDMLVHCGDVFNSNGHGSVSIYGEYFNDENFMISHQGGGVVSMANKGKDTNGSQFFFTLGAARFLDKKHVAFGKVVKGFQYLAAINRVGSLEHDATPKRPIRFTDCSVNEVKRYELSVKDMKTDDLEGIVSY